MEDKMCERERLKAEECDSEAFLQKIPLERNSKMKTDGNRRSSLFSSKSKRLRVLLMVFFSLFAQGMMRTNMGMAMVCMVNSTVGQNERADIEESVLGICGNTSHSETKSLHYDGTFTWSNDEQSHVFAAFFWGGIVSVMMTARLSEKFGPTNLILGSGISNVIGTFLTPLAADEGVWWLTAVRFVMGFAQGGLYPLSAQMIASWFPAHERSLASAIYSNGNQLSFVFAMLFSSQLCQLEEFGGWRIIFYAYGTLGVVMCTMWWWIVTDTPHDDRYISEDELNYIVGNQKHKQLRAPTPWSKMFTSPLVLTLVLCSIAHGLIVVTLTTYLPQYFKHVLQMDLTANGIWSALPFVCQMLMNVLIGALADSFRKTFPKRLDVITKCSQSLATIGAAVCLMILSLLSCGQEALAVFMICLTISCLAGNIGGLFTSLLSVAPSHTAGLNSVARFFAQTGSVVTPYMVGYFTKKNTPDEWAIVFWIIATVLACCGISFCVYGTVEPQKWSIDEHSAEEKIASSEIEKMATDKTSI